MSERPEIRIGDAERDAAVQALGEHYAAGRLTKEEYDDRADRAWAARTNSDLRPLFVDLPSPSTQRRADVPREQRQRPSRLSPFHGGGWAVPWTLLMLLAVVLVVGVLHRAFPLFLLFVGVWVIGSRRRGGRRR